MFYIFMIYVGGFIGNFLPAIMKNSIDENETYPLAKSLAESILWPMSFSKDLLKAILWIPKQGSKEIKFFLDSKKGDEK